MKFKDAKRVKKEVEEEKEKVTKLEEERKAMLERHKDTTSYTALVKVMKHITKEKKYSKCLEMVERLLVNAIDIFCPNTLMNVMALCLFNFKVEHADKLKTIYNLICEAIGEDESQYTDTQCEMVNLWEIPVLITSSFNTSDSFEFNDSLKNLQGVFDEIP